MRRFQTSYFSLMFNSTKQFACSCENGYIASLLPPSSTTCRLRTRCASLFSLVFSTQNPCACSCKLVRVYIRVTSASRPRVHTSKFPRVHARPRPLCDEQRNDSCRPMSERTVAVLLTKSKTSGWVASKVSKGRPWSSCGELHCPNHHGIQYTLSISMYFP